MILIGLVTINKETLLCVPYMKKYYANLHTEDVTCNKKIWKTIKPCFSDKHKISERIFLIQNDEMVMEDGKHLFFKM